MMGTVDLETEPARWGLYSATYPEEWAKLQFSPGDVFTATVPSDFAGSLGVQASFVVLGSFLDGAGGLVAQVRSLGSSVAEVTTRLSSSFNRRSGYIHLCRDVEECEYQDGVVFHLRVLQLQDPVDFQADYVGAAGKRLLKQIMAEHGIGGEKEGTGVPGDPLKPGEETIDAEALGERERRKIGERKAKEQEMATKEKLPVAERRTGQNTRTCENN